MYPDERQGSAEQFLCNAYFASLGVPIEAVLSDNNSTFRSKAFNRACAKLGLKHRYTRAYRPQTKGKAERFIQSGLREWAYGFTYQQSTSRPEALDVDAPLQLASPTPRHRRYLTMARLKKSRTPC